MPTTTRPVLLALLVLLGLIAPALAQEAVQDPPAAPEAAAKPAGEGEASRDWMANVDAWFGESLVGPLATVFLLRPGSPVRAEDSVPAVVAWLAVGAVFLTLRMGFINVRAFVHAIRVTKGDYDSQDVGDSDGEVSHFQALSSALSATVGLGNIGSVAVAVGIGGPGAIFWMVMCGLFGMSSKFTECSLGRCTATWTKTATCRAVRCGTWERDSPTCGWGGSVGRSRSCSLCFVLGPPSAEVARSKCPVSFGRDEALVEGLGYAPETLDDTRWVYGLVMAALVGVVIIGGIKRIAATAEKIVPLMCVVYVITAAVILMMNYDKIPAALSQIFALAWAKESAFGGALGAAMLGIKRAAFSNEAGVGSAAIAHSAAKTKYPVREGIVALLEPFIDTVLICTMTGWSLW